MSQLNNKNRKNSRNPNRNVTNENSNKSKRFYPEALHKIQLHQSNNFTKCPVPITFRHLGELVDEMLAELEDMNSHFAKHIYTEENKQIYKKVCFFLAELKLEWSVKYVYSIKTDHLRRINLSEHPFRTFNIPYPLALYLDSIGCFENKSIHYVPVPAITENHITDACYSCMPYKFIDILKELANGVEIEKVPVAAQKSLKSLPTIEWVKIKNDEGVETHIKLAPESVRFWLKPQLGNASDQLSDLNCTHSDFAIFNDMNDTLSAFPGMLTIDYRIDSGEGNASQLVRFVKNEKNSREIHWYTMRGVPEEYKKIGIIFGFGHFDEPVQPSIAIGDPSTAHTIGHEYNPSFLRHALFEPILNAKLKYRNNSSDSD